MQYNFDEIIDRKHTHCINTDGFRGYIFHAGPEKKFPYADDEFVRMWIADMEFGCAPEICEAIKARVDRRIFGYSGFYDREYYQCFSKWCRDMYDWEFPEEQLTYSTGVIPALYQLVELLCQKDEKVLMLSPAYGFFQHAAEYNNVEYVCSKLKIDKGHFSIDFADLAEKAKDSKVKVLIWCNPQNPSGNTWSEAELKQVADIARANDLWLISDEIHCDLLRSGLKHIPMAKAEPDYDKLITCMSASKTFNMAGLQFSDIIIRNKELREAYIGRDKNVGFYNPLSMAAHQAAYEHGSEWLKQLKAYLDGNFRFLKDFIDKNLPEAEFEIPNATYLAWVKIGPCIPEIEDWPGFFANNAGVLLEGGDDLFVGNAKGYIRLNLAMPRAIIEKGLNRIKDAIEAYKKNK